MSDLFYLDTRLHAMRAQLLSRREVETILALPDLSSIAAALRETPYGRFIESTGGEVPEAARIEEALRRNVSQTLARLLVLASGDCAEAVRLVLGRWEVQAVKTILRGIVSGASPAEILSSLVPTGLHDDAALEEMCRQADPRALAELMVDLAGAVGPPPPPGPPFVPRAPGPRGPGIGPRPMLVRAGGFPAPGDPAFPARGGQRGRPVPVRLPLRRHDQPHDRPEGGRGPDRPVEPGPESSPRGRIFDESALDRVRASPTLAEALKEAGRSRFLQPLAALPAPAEGVPFLAVVERQLDRVLLRASRYLARVDPLGWGPLVSFLLDKLREVRNLRMIVRARLVDLPEAELGHLLILEY